MHLKEFIKWFGDFPACGGMQMALAGVPHSEDGQGGGPGHGTGGADFFGGGGPSTPPKQSIPMPPPVEIPKPPPPPPPTESKIEVEEAAAQQRRDAKRRQGMSKSLIAGETGGYKSSATDSGSLLG